MLELPQGLSAIEFVVAMAEWASEKESGCCRKEGEGVGASKLHRYITRHENVERLKCRLKLLKDPTEVANLPSCILGLKARCVR